MCQLALVEVLLLGQLSPIAYGLQILTPLNIFWIKLGILIGKFVSPIIMGLVFFLVVTPIGLIFRSAGKDFLRLKKNSTKNTYWIDKESYKTSMKKQF